MADRHFDLNAALNEAEPDEDTTDPWFSFDLGPNYQPPTPEPAEPDAEGKAEEPAAPAPVPWRLNRDAVGGWLVMKWLTTNNTIEQMALTMRMVRNGIDPDQWPQFEQMLEDGPSKARSMRALNQLVQVIVRDNLGLPLAL